MATSMSALLRAGFKPKRIKTYDIGTGNFVPLEDMSLCFVRLQAAGAGGGAYNSSLPMGGGAGAMTEFFMRVPIAGVPYVVGAGGLPGQPGSASKFGFMASAPGKPNSADTAGAGGQLSIGSDGVCGGSGGSWGVPGQLAGGTVPGSALGGGSFYGAGGAPGANGGIGAGGGGINAGVYGQGGKGFIEIWEFGELA